MGKIQTIELIDLVSMLKNAKITNKYLNLFQVNPYDSIYNNQDDYNYNANDSNKEHHNPNVLLGFLTVIMGGIVISTIIYIFYKWCQKSENNDSVPNNGFVHNTYQGITADNTDFMYNIQDISVQDTDHSADFERPLINIINHHSNYLDLPPTYADSTSNSRASSIRSLHSATDRGHSHIVNLNNDDSCTLPPTYEEALANIVVSESVHDTDATPTTAQDCNSSTSVANTSNNVITN